MTRAFVLLTLSLITACASTPSRDRGSRLSFDSINRTFAPDLTQEQVLEKFGPPDSKQKSTANERWQYLAPKTLFDRAQFIFNESKTLIQIVWNPLPGENEMNIEQILKQFPKAYFESSNTTKVSNHSLKSNTTLSGESVSIFREDSTNKVLAVAWFAKNH
ncbi:MAG: hypothetical protein AB7F86_00210 [Bdellovibrionales bacterium]